MATPQQGMARLIAAAESGELDDLARRFGIRVITVFGSTGRGEPDPQDLDIGVLFETRAPGDFLTLYGELANLTGTEIDLGDINAGSPLFADRALGHAIPVWECEPGAWIDATVAAALESMDTRWLRRVDLERRAAG